MAAHSRGTSQPPGGDERVSVTENVLCGGGGECETDSRCPQRGAERHRRAGQAEIRDGKDLLGHPCLLRLLVPPEFLCLAAVFKCLPDYCTHSFPSNALPEDKIFFHNPEFLNIHREYVKKDGEKDERERGPECRSTHLFGAHEAAASPMGAVYKDKDAQSSKCYLDKCSGLDLGGQEEVNFKG